MITEKEYNTALGIVHQYETEQKEITNAKRMTIEYFINNIPNKRDNRVIGALKDILEWQYEGKNYIYIDEIDDHTFRKFRKVGTKSLARFLEYKEKILSEHGNK